MSDKEHAGEMRNQYGEALRIAEGHFRQASEIQKMYSGDNFDVGTGSDIRFPMLYQLTEELLPGIWKGLFPRGKMIRLSERFGSGANHERIVKSEKFLHFLIKHSGLATEGVKTVKDSLKFGKGYGVVELERFSIPEEVAIILANASTGAVARSTETRATVRYMPVYKYLPYHLVVPTPDGDTPESVSCVYVLRFFDERELRDMYEQDAALPEEHRKMKLTADEVLKKTEEAQLDGGKYPLYWIMAGVAGMQDRLNSYRQLAEIQRFKVLGSRKSRMLVTPVLQCKYDTEEYWLANGEQMIYSVTSKDKICKDVVACSGNNDGNDWWAQGPIMAAGDLHLATNILWRTLLDVAARVGDPIKLVNQFILEDPPDEMLPGTTLKTRSAVGDLRNAFTYAQSPPLPEGFTSLAGAFQEQASRTIGRPIQLSGQGGAGLVRGGSAAFESYLSTATGREKLLMGLIQSGWLIPTLEMILRSQQIVMPAKMKFSMSDGGDPAEERVQTITREDFAREYDVEIDPDAKYDLSTAERAVRLNEYNLILKDNPDFDWKAAAEYALGDGPGIARLRATPETRDRQIKELQARAQQAKQARQAEQGASGGAMEGAEMQGVQGGLKRQETA